MASKIDPNFERRFFEKTSFFLGKTMILKDPGVEVESKNRSKIDIKNDAETEGLGNSIFIDF